MYETEAGSIISDRTEQFGEANWQKCKISRQELDDVNWSKEEMKYGSICSGIEAASDGPRYKALENSMAVPVMKWIGERITKIDSIK